MRAIVLTALLLGLLAPRALGFVVHDHDASHHPTNAEPCSACTLGHAPAMASATVGALDGPRMVDVRLGVASGEETACAFDYALPYACGPPA